MPLVRPLARPRARTPSRTAPIAAPIAFPVAFPAAASFLAACAVAVTGCAAFPEAGDAPSVPVPVRPADAADVVANARTRFVWAPVEGASGYDFHVFDRTTRDIERYRRDGLRARDVCDADACSIETSLSLPRVKDHAWRVRAVGRGGASEWSRARFAMVDVGGASGARAARAPDVPEPTAPLGATLRADDVATFEWSASADALGYDFHLFDATTRGLASELRDLAPADVCDASGRCSVLVAPGLPPASNHAWRVRATNGYGASGWTRTTLAVAP